MGKTVYVLGAGFSKPAGFPLQREIYPEVVSQAFLASRSVLSSHPYLTFDVSQDVFLFLTAARFVNARNGKLCSELSLEDLFTLLDRVIQDRGTYCGYNWATRRTSDHRKSGQPFRPSLIEVRDSLVRSILAILHGCSDKHSKKRKSLFRQFAAYLIQWRLNTTQQGDPFSVISLNWDSLLEDSIYRVLSDTGGIVLNRAAADVDYCVYTYPLVGSPHMPSTKQKAAGIYNLKILKLHGSANWLRCPNSNVVYTGLGSSESSQALYVKARRSPFVTRYPDGKAPPPDLEPYIITPSFTKVFDLPQIQATWHNAYVELREATKIVFIGYSLPDADHQVRTLLRRAIRPAAYIEVVLPPTKEVKKLGRKAPVAMRFYEVFGRRKLDFRFGGTEAYIEKVASVKKHAGMLRDLRAEFALHREITQ